MTSMLSKMGLLFFLLSNTGDYASGLSDTYAFDPFLQESFKCFWHVACDLNEPLKIKKASDEIQDPQKEFVLTEVFPHLVEHLRLMKTVEDFNSDEFWLNVFPNQACEWSAEDRDRFLPEIQPPFMEHFLNICYDEESVEQCNAVNKANKMYHEMEAEMIARKECNVTPVEFQLP